MSSYSRIRAYLEAHPTPWHIADGYRLADVRRDGMGCDDTVETSRVWEVRDANTARVLPPCEPSPQIKDLVDFVNLVGEEYEPQHGWPGLEGKPYDYGVEHRPLTPEQWQEIRDVNRWRWSDVPEWFEQALHTTEGAETWQPATNGYEVSTHGRARTPDGTILTPTRSMGGRNIYQLPDGVELIAPVRKRDWDKP